MPCVSAMTAPPTIQPPWKQGSHTLLNQSSLSSRSFSWALFLRPFKKKSGEGTCEQRVESNFFGNFATLSGSPI
eukprot:COSAG03_NODE_206_length_10644_cov_8.779896_1_plen_74_part_00